MILFAGCMRAIPGAVAVNRELQGSLVTTALALALALSPLVW